MVCHRMCDYDHNYPEEEERLTLTTGDTTAPGEGSHYDATTRMTAIVTTMQDRLQERSEDKRTTALWDYVIRPTDELRLLLLAFFSHGSRAGTMTTRGDSTTTRVATAVELL